ncbi:aromatic compound dioxygenase [Guyanagaster necrorhizus]|uniref:Aromatic compound dioxygenase n=1 Tax=Guyanagaster necrorhizus TaxID=856835 RepID=A0A9P7VHC1_9AGAR|nr:aromatic compound dioxygenase [Guyanagaster necrorhizus MCA 3950]KAG7440588.1 aromatic compound dioxygenase [Guyanagaster necrorhizus MCA 3950]
MVSALTRLFLAASVVSSVVAHASPAPANWKRDNLEARHALEKRCGDVLAARRRKRSESALARRSSGVLRRTTSSNDSTCLVTPEVTQGPYHILGEIVRQNITEGQGGIPLEVSVDFMDISTCDPVQVWVDAWHANATGFYAGYIAETGSALAGGSGAGSPSGDASASLTSGATSISDAPTQTVATTSTSYGAYDGADSPSATQLLNEAVDDNSTFLRGVWQTDDDGHLTMYSVFPGWYSGRAQHFHIKAYPEGYIAANGTFIAGGSAVHTGQFFFDQDTLDAVAANPVYAANAISWSDSVSNDDDMWYPYQSATGYDATMDITWVGDEITDGLVGSITVPLNMTYESPEVSTQYASFDVEEYEAEGLLPEASLSA